MDRSLYLGVARSDEEPDLVLGYDSCKVEEPDLLEGLSSVIALVLRAVAGDKVNLGVLSSDYSCPVLCPVLGGAAPEVLTRV